MSLLFFFSFPAVTAASLGIVIEKHVRKSTEFDPLFAERNTRNGEGKGSWDSFAHQHQPLSILTRCPCVCVCARVLRRRRHDAGRLVCREKFRANKRPNKSSLARTGPPSDFSTPCNAASTAKQLTLGVIFLGILILHSFLHSKLISVYHGNYMEKIGRLFRWPQ